MNRPKSGTRPPVKSQSLAAKPSNVVPIDGAVRRINKLARKMANNRPLKDPIPAPFAEFYKQPKEGDIYSRQTTPEDAFAGSYTRKNLIVPPYDPARLYAIFESSSILSPHVDVYVQNIDGFEIIFKYKGPKGKKDSKVSKKEKEDLKLYFSKVNERQSFRTVRGDVRRDYEVTGNGYMEVTRNVAAEIACLYHLEGKYIRVSRIKHEEYQDVETTMYRKGKPVKFTVQRKFRKYAQVIPSSNVMRWFKEYGDTRVMDATTGEFMEAGKKPKEIASELIHFKQGTGAYGLPRYIGNVLGILGVRNADYVNYDLFDSQGIPPLAILVSGGILTQESIDTIESLLRQAKGFQNFNRILLLEAQSEGGIDDKIAPKVVMQPLREARAEDAMFQKYISATDEKVRTDFRLPPIYLGLAQEYNRATVEFSRIIAEEQVFEPERNLFDEQIENTIMTEVKAKYWAFKSGRPPLVTGEGLLKGFDSFGKAGVFTINQALDIANKAMNLDLEEIEEEWADYPLTIITRLLDRGLFVDLEHLVGVLEGTSQFATETALLPAGTGEGDEVIDAEVVSEVQKFLRALHEKAKQQLSDMRAVKLKTEDEEDNKTEE